jgi:hypothetical protein
MKAVRENKEVTIKMINWIIFQLIMLETLLIKNNTVLPIEELFLS